MPSHQLTETERKMEQDVATQYPHGLPVRLAVDSGSKMQYRPPPPLGFLGEASSAWSTHVATQ